MSATRNKVHGISRKWLRWSVLTLFFREIERSRFCKRLYQTNLSFVRCCAKGRSIFTSRSWQRNTAEAIYGPTFFLPEIAHPILTPVINQLSSHPNFTSMYLGSDYLRGMPLTSNSPNTSPDSIEPTLFHSTKSFTTRHNFGILRTDHFRIRRTKSWIPSLRVEIYIGLDVTTEAKGNSYSMILQPETRPISQEQLAAEIEGIYAGLETIEARCIEVDQKLATLIQTRAGAEPRLHERQWQALVALHRTLLHEHHDFLLASQHPSADPALRKLALECNIPARMWRHGVHSLVEALQHHLPSSLDFMLAFLYLSYSIMALLYESVPIFAETWAEYLRNISWYRMALEDEGSQDWEVWTCNAHYWNSKIDPKELE
ncbi:uncharacterized protein PAC_02012 [Phialocephala subalpina]|uniref:Uncharacterized protein n=1 Tax=Phialocephala subalpina TaxID=576137 RepID=A0A1L7WHA7_9HELO|nr:uncharacterized protein PAC_02012 [Phialocephala subalpina]